MFKCVGFFLVLMFAPIVQAQQIDKVDVTGNEKVLASTILLQVSSESGEQLNAAQVEKDIKEIYRTGFFRRVGAELGAQGGKTTLRFVVEEKPAIRNVYIEGNKEVDEETLKEKLNIGGRRFFDPLKLKPGIDEAKAYYFSQGFFGTKITYETENVADNEVDITFVVEEGEEKVIREIVFEGNETVDSDDLEDRLETSVYKWWSSWLTSSGILNEEKLENDVRGISGYYLTHGYVDVNVAEPEVDEIEEGLRIIYKVVEGEIYAIGTVRVAGDLIEESDAKTLEGTKTKAEEIFNIELIRTDTFTITDKFTDIGYAFTNVEPDTDINREKKLVDVTFRVNKGGLVYIDQIILSGNEKTRDNVIRRSLQIHERELFSSSRIKRSQELLQRLGFFEEVTITSDPTQKESEVDLNVAVREGNTGAFSVGAGVSSGDGFIFNTRVSENNVFGTGRSVTFDINTGSQNENYVLSLRDPRINDGNWSGSIDLLSVEQEFDDFDRKQTGGAVTAGYPLWFLGQEYLDDVRLSLKYELVAIDIDDVDELDAPQLVIDQQGESTSSSVTPGITRDTIDNPLDPANGSRQVAGIELAGIGGNQEFWQVNVSNAFYYPLYEMSFGKLVFAQRTKFGWGKTFDGEDFPLFRRYFPGGINSVRGYDARELGPQDEEGNAYGGDKQLVGNFELIFPLIPPMGLNGLVFYDIGNAFDDGEAMEFDGLAQAIGWGVRWRSPIAPIRIEIGYPIDRVEGDHKSVVTNFSFGAPF